jgi:hypothetical protein
MMLSNPLIGVAMLFILLSLIFLIMTVVALKKRKLFGTAMNLVMALLMISLSTLFGTISVAIKGYHALTREELAAMVKVEPTGEQKFMARFSMPDGSEKVFSLVGDQLYVDAHILKWKPLASIYEYTFRFNRRNSKARGLLFHRLMEQAAQVSPMTHRQMAGDNMKSSIRPPF